MSNWVVVLALVLVTGGHWALLQSVAWTGMAVSYSRQTSLTKALKMTFDGKHPCPLCKIVKAGKAAEKKRDLVKVDFKFEAAPFLGSRWLVPPQPIRHFLPESECAAGSVHAPLVPPPRAA